MTLPPKSRNWKFFVETFAYPKRSFFQELKLPVQKTGWMGPLANFKSLSLVSSAPMILLNRNEIKHTVFRKNLKKSYLMDGDKNYLLVIFPQ